MYAMCNHLNRLKEAIQTITRDILFWMYKIKSAYSVCRLIRCYNEPQVAQTVPISNKLAWSQGVWAII